MVLGLFVDLTVVDDNADSSGARFSHKETRATMAGIVPVFILLDKASIFSFLDLAFDLVDLVLWGRTRMPSHHRPSKLWLEFEVHVDGLFA